MAAETKLSHTAAMILQAVNAGYVYGFSVMEMTGLPSGTVYPAMRRLERDELIRSHWEQQSIADAEQRPPRKYYKLTTAGKATLEASRKRYPLLAKLIPGEQEEAAMRLRAGVGSACAGPGCACGARRCWCRRRSAWRGGWSGGRSCGMCGRCVPRTHGVLLDRASARSRRFCWVRFKTRFACEGGERTERIRWDSMGSATQCMFTLMGLLAGSYGAALLLPGVFCGAASAALSRRAAT